MLTARFLDALRGAGTKPETSPAGDDTRVRPGSVDEAAAVVRLCAEHGVAIVPVGGDTGLSGGTEVDPSAPTILFSTERLNRIRSVDPDRWTMTVEAGVTIEAVQEAAAAADRQFAPDWGARGSATVGGAVATDAGGNNVIRYGNMRENVLGVEAILGNGEVWNGLRALRKDSTGYDLKHLFIGSEGTLGIVTAAVLRLVPATPVRATALAALGDLQQLPAVLEQIRNRGDTSLTAIELMPDEGIRHAADRFGLAHPLPEMADHHVLISLAGGDGVVDDLTALLENLSDNALIVDAVVASSTEQSEALWTIRDAQSPTQSRPELVDAALKYDIAVPLDRVADLLGGIEAAVADSSPDAYAHSFGHVGDGNIHVWVLPSTADGIENREVTRAVIDELVMELGGTLSAEHGIGTLLRDRVGPQKPDVEWSLMHRIKEALDPQGIFNPGKMLPNQPPT